MSYSLYGLCFLLNIIHIESARILAVYSTPSLSHQVVFRPLMVELAKRGHEVVVITTDPAFPENSSIQKKKPINLTEIDVHDVSYHIWNDFIKISKGSEADVVTQVKFALELFVEIVAVQIKTEGVQALIRDKKDFDLLFIEACILPALGFSHIFKAPVILFSSFGGSYANFDDVGAPINPVVYPGVFQRRFHNITHWIKLSEINLVHTFLRLAVELDDYNNKNFERIFGSNIPDIKELKNNIHMLFLNTNPIWDFNRPVPPNVIYLGGLQNYQRMEKSLSEDIQSYLDSSKNGVIYMSLGTNVKPSLLPSDKIKIFLDVFSQLPYDVLMKWDKDDLPGRSNNTRIFKWLPQSDLLRHPKIKVFITQGGLQSTDESISAAVPLIGIPMLGDQWYNTEQYVRHNIGMKLSIVTLTEEILKDAIETVIKDDSYRKNIEKFRDIIYDQPQTPLERAVWWTEYVLRHKGAKHLRASAFGLTWWEYYEIDLILTLTGAVVIIASLMIYLLYFIINKYWVSNKLKKH